MTTINERLREYLTSQKIADKEIYNKIGTSQPVFSGWIKQGRAIPLNKLSAIVALLPEINVRWLLTGSGNISFDYKAHEQKGGLFLVEDSKGNCTDPAEINKLLASKDETITAQKITINALTELLGNNFLTGDEKTTGNARKKPIIKGYRGIHDPIIFQKLLSELIPKEY